MGGQKAVQQPILVVYQPDNWKIIQSSATEELKEWERKIEEWSGVKADQLRRAPSGGTCSDSGNDCDVD